MRKLATKENPTKAVVWVWTNRKGQNVSIGRNEHTIGSVDFPASHWVVSCHDHGGFCNFETKAQAMTFTSDVSNFCEGCTE